VDAPLLRTLVAGAGSSSQFLGGLVIFLLYFVIGLLSAIGSILVFCRVFEGRWEQIFWALFLAVIAAFYLNFAAYFEASTHAWQTEVIAVAVFVASAVGGLFFRSAIAVGYVMHGLWDFISLSLRVFTFRTVDNGNPAGLRYLLLDVRFYGRVLPHDQRYRLACARQARPLLLAWSVTPTLMGGEPVPPRANPIASREVSLPNDGIRFWSDTNVRSGATEARFEATAYRADCHRRRYWRGLVFRFG